jgi:hypothetical protein
MTKDHTMNKWIFTLILGLTVLFPVAEPENLA